VNTIIVSKDANDYMPRSLGLMRDRDHEPKLKEQLCGTCAHKNGPDNRFCQKCGRPLQLKTALEYTHKRTEASNILNELGRDPRFVKMLRRFMRNGSS